MIPRTLSILLLTGTLAFTAGADRNADKEVRPEGKTRVRLGGVTVGAGYARYSGYYPFNFGYYSAAWNPYYWSPFWSYYAPMYYPGFYPGYLRSSGPVMGEVKLAAPGNAEVYLNGAFAGTADDLKTIWLEPGAYDLEVRPPTGDAYTRRIYVLSGKRLKIDALQGEAKK
ncbi:MAG TPA: hypothetical protein VN428_23375 [Bryobacteraceae bacterium]|nr:hypothetical protein [Bryobacteraceae bacterium]